MASQDVFLTPDERYEVWEVKKEERPHLMLVQADAAGDDDAEELPLVDGCDIPGWRQAGLVSLSASMESVLNVGPGCSLLRRDTQIPLVSSLSAAMQKWKKLQEIFLQPPSVTAKRIAKEEAAELSFYPWFERENVPVILEGLADDWPAMQSCTWESLVERFGDHYWRFSDTHAASMTLRTYTKYVHTLDGMVDDSPLGVYDSQLDGDERASVLEEYNVPECFGAPDLFEALEEDDRPPYRWILMGPARSGTGLHIDPMGTHAWVTVIEGLKRWVLFPYGTDPSLIGVQEPQIPSALWFEKWYDRAMEQVEGAVEVLQRPGETVYVPSGWPHLVLNLEPTVAVTHNYATEYPNISRCAHFFEEEEPEVFPKWVEILESQRPDLSSQLLPNCRS